MNKRKRHDYVAVREAYRLTPASITLTAFAKKMAIPLRTLQAKMERDAKAGNPWERDLTKAVKHKTREMQLRISANLPTDEPITDEAVAIATAATTNVLVLEAHGELMKRSRDLLGNSLTLLKGQIDRGIMVINGRGKDAGPMEVDVEADYVARSLSGITTSLERIVKMERHHLGVDDNGSDSAHEDDLEDLARAMGINVNAEGDE